ncbi:MAG: GNAT family N-acetyltransferase [Bacteroidia bacterium]
MAALREISVDDAAQIAFLSTQLGYNLNVDETTFQIKEVLSHPDHCAFVIAKEDKIIGWIHAFKTMRIESPPFVEIGGLVIDENHRGQGIGNKLVEKIKAWTLENNFSKVRVRCSTKRKEAHLFYNKIGFTESKEQKIFEVSLEAGL